LQYRFGWDIVLATTPTIEGYGNLYGIIAFLSFCIVFLFASYEPTRRETFELFFYTHFFFLLGWIFAMIHSQFTLSLLIVPALLWFVDHVIRTFRSNAWVQIMSAKTMNRGAGKRITKLEIFQPGFKYEPGQYVFIQVPTISRLQWHPFSISSFVDPNHCQAYPGDTFSFHIMDMGPGTWTNQLAEQAKHLGKNDITLFIDGPHGSFSLPVFEYPVIVLCAGGVGATPLMSLFGDLLQRRSEIKTLKEVHLIWVNQDEAPFHEWFPKLLQKAMNEEMSSVFHLHLYVTNSKREEKKQGKEGKDAVTGYEKTIEMETPKKKDESKDDDEKASFNSKALTIKSGRPVYDQLFDEIQGKHASSDIAVLACGPAPMVGTVQNCAMDRRFHFHKETFLL